MFSKHQVPGTYSFSTMTAFLEIMNKNILYLTHTTDKCLVVLNRLELQQKLQTQVDEYFDDKSETSPQTESEEHL